MAKRDHTPPPSGTVSSGAPPEAIRMEFARRLQAALNARGWTQSELARRMAPLLKHSRLGRDNISKYVRGKVLPLPPALEAMAKVLEIKTFELLPARVTPSAGVEYPPYERERYWRRKGLAPDQSICDLGKRAGNSAHPARGGQE